MTTLITSQRSPGAAFGGMVAAIVIGGTCAVLAADPALTTMVRVVTGVVGGLLAAALALTAVRLARPRGGLHIDRDKGRLGIGLTSQDDVYWIPLESVQGVGVRFHDVRREATTFRSWSAEILCTDRPSVLLVEATERDVVDNVVDMLTGEDGLERIGSRPVESDADAESVEEPETLEVPETVELPETAMARVGVHKGGALSDVLFLFGASLAAVGVALFAQLHTEPMVAVFIAPVILLLGAVLFGISATKRVAAEEIEVRHNRVYHRWRLGNFAWGEDDISAKGLRWRLRVQALKGAYLEALSQDGSLAIGSGATTHSKVDIAGLNRFPQRLTSSPSAPAPKEP